MLNKILKVSAFTITFSCVLFLIYGIIEKVAAKKTVLSKIQSVPKTHLFNLDSSSFSFPHSTVALIFFNSDCEHCQYELDQINKNQKLFNNKEVVLLSFESMSSIKKASKTFKLDDLPNIHFAKINEADVFPSFGSLSVPHVFIYDNDHRLVKEFRGETKVEAIAKYLP